MHRGLMKKIIVLAINGQYLKPEALVSIKPPRLWRPYWVVEMTDGVTIKTSNVTIEYKK
jgi:hypothetical protein